MPAPNQALLALLLSKFGKGNQPSLPATHQPSSAARQHMQMMQRTNGVNPMSNQFMSTQTPAMQEMLKYLDYKFFNPGIAGRNDSPGGGNVFGGFFRGTPDQLAAAGGQYGSNPASANVGNYGFLGGGPGGTGLSNMNHQGSWLDMFGKGTGQDQGLGTARGGMGEFLSGNANQEGEGRGFGGTGSSGTYYE